jgi:phage shock protein E
VSRIPGWDTLWGMQSPLSRFLVVPLAAAALLAGCSSESAESGANADTGAADTQSSAETFPSVNGAVVSVESFEANMETDGTTIVDVRTPEEFAAGHIDGAINIELGSPGFDDLLQQMDPDATYAVYCQSDNRSGQAVQRMLSEDFTSVYHLNGGIVAWTEAGNEVVTL